MQIVLGHLGHALLDVLLEGRLQLERLGADLAAVGARVRVRGQMVLEAGHLTEGLGADVADEGLVARVYAHVLAQDVLRLEGLLADVAGVLGVAAVAQVAAVEGALLFQVRGRRRLGQ